MIGRKSVLGLSLLGAMMLCAFTAQSAFAVEGWTEDKNSTAYTCSPTAPVKAFTDAHCDNVTGGAKEYGHEVIKAGETTEIEVTNAGTKGGTTESTPAELHADPFGVAITVTAQEISGGGWIRNNGTEHKIEGTVTTVYTELSVDDEIGPCEVARQEGKEEAEIKFPANFHSVHKANGEMGLEYTPDSESGNFVEFAVVCELLGEIPVKVSGNAVGVGAHPKESNSGATQNFRSENEELEMEGATETTFAATYTTRMAGHGNPIAGTTGP